MSNLSLATAHTDVSPLEMEQLTKAVHSAQFLQSDLQLLLASQNPMLAELVLRELAVVNPLVTRLLHLSTMSGM
jgi:hypothetical protein